MIAKKYTSENIDTLDWNDVPNGLKLKSFYLPVIKSGSRVYVENSANQVDLIRINNFLIPVSIGSKMRLPNFSYVYSFDSQYFKYSREEVLKSTDYSKSEKWLAKYGIPVSSGLHRSLKGRDMVFVNGLGLSTGLYPDLSANDWKMLISFLRKSYPDKAIIYRGVNDCTDSLAINLFEFNGMKAVASRRLLMMDPKAEKYKKKRPFQQDKKRWEKQEKLYWDVPETVGKKDAGVVLDYYRELYLNKYSKLNPNYTMDFVQKAHEAGVLKFMFLRKIENEEIVGVQAVMANHKTITTPFIGYQLDAPKDERYYPFMNHKLMELSIENELIFNMSSGADKFKEQRGGEQFVEYHYVDSDHLTLVKRKNWEMIHLISDKFAKSKFQNQGAALN